MTSWQCTMQAQRVWEQAQPKRLWKKRLHEDSEERNPFIISRKILTCSKMNSSRPFYGRSCFDPMRVWYQQCLKAPAVTNCFDHSNDPLKGSSYSFNCHFRSFYLRLPALGYISLLFLCLDRPYLRNFLLSKNVCFHIYILSLHAYQKSSSFMGYLKLETAILISMRTHICM